MENDVILFAVKTGQGARARNKNLGLALEKGARL
jgi:hypothetical protein